MGFINVEATSSHRVSEEINRNRNTIVRYRNYEVFESPQEVRKITDEWLHIYSDERPHDSLDDMTRLVIFRLHKDLRKIGTKLGGVKDPL